MDQAQLLTTNLQRHRMKPTYTSSKQYTKPAFIKLIHYRTSNIMLVFQVSLGYRYRNRWLVVALELQNLQTPDDTNTISRIGRHGQQQSTIEKRIHLQGSVAINT